MVSSGGGGDYQQPATPQPEGGVTPFGKSTPFNPSYTSVLNTSGWTDPTMVDKGLAKGPTALDPAAAVTASGAANQGGMGGSDDAFAQKVLDWHKNQQLGAYMMGLGGPQGMAAGMPMMTAQAPTPTSPSQQLMLMALQQRAGGGHVGPWGSGGGGSGSSGGQQGGGNNRGGYGSSRS